MEFLWQVRLTAATRWIPSQSEWSDHHECWNETQKSGFKVKENALMAVYKSWSFTPRKDFIKKPTGSENMKSSVLLFLHRIFSLYGHNCQSEVTVMNSCETHEILTAIVVHIPASRLWGIQGCLQLKKWELVINLQKQKFTFYIHFVADCFPSDIRQQLHLMGAAFSSNSCRNMFEKQETLVVLMLGISPLTHKSFKKRKEKPGEAEK